MKVITNKLLFLTLFLLNLQAFAQIAPEDFIADFESGNVSSVQQVGADSFTFAIRHRRQ
jgi:hypothetical protein